ncbi:MAG TPA: hypothetical protein VJ553_05725 [Candidatus Paceibacterota bacterium]|nr:hypothetical protein [Candidatus Paceibacterota bacterium]
MATPSFEQFAEIKAEAETFYAGIGAVYSPYLKKSVAFNAKGLDHLKLKEWNKARSIDDQCRRLRIIQYAPLIVQASHTVQGLSYVDRFERRQTNSRWERVMMRIVYYEFIAVLQNIRIRCIVKELPGGQPFFWSIMPYWRTDGNGRRRFTYGNPEID